jgi:phosphate transport system protein
MHIKEINEQLVKMGAEVEEAIAGSIIALKEQNIELAHQVIRNDDCIDLHQQCIENQLIHIIATQNPVATDLRQMMSIANIVTDLERMADHAVNISRAVIKISEEPFIKPLIDIPQMAKIVGTMVRKSLNAYITMDTALAKEVAMTDDIVDELYEMVYMELLYKLKDYPEHMTQIIQLLFVGRYLERIADHATNICERVIYMVDGVREKY